MKKTQILFAAFILSFVADAASAQGFYLRLGLGYGFPEAGQTIDGTGQPYNGTQNNPSSGQTYSLKAASFSSGFQGGIGAGYMFSEHVGVQLDINAGLSTKKYTFNDNDVNVGGVTSNVSVVQQAKTPVFMIPALVVQSDGEKWNIYSRLGLALPLNTKITQDQIITNAPGTGSLEVDDYTLSIKNSFSVGFAAAAGVEYKFNDRVSVWGEVSLLSMSAYIKEADLTAVTSNGQSVPLSAVSGAQTIKYSKNASVDSSGSQQPAYSQPFSNVGVSFGVRFQLSKTSHHSRGRGSNDDVIDNSKPYRRR